MGAAGIMVAGIGARFGLAGGAVGGVNVAGRVQGAAAARPNIVRPGIAAMGRTTKGGGAAVRRLLKPKD